MASNTTLPKPKGVEDKPMSALEKARTRPRAPLGGAPPVRMPDFAAVEAEAREKSAQGDQTNRPQQPENYNRRSPEEIKSDMEKLNSAAKEYNESLNKEPPKPMEPAPEVAGGVDTTSSETQETIKKMVEEMDDFELDSYNRMLEEDDDLNNDRRRRAIESRCKAMNLIDLITEGSVHQKVPIVPGQFEVTYRSVSSGEDLEIKRMLYSIRKEVPRYQVDAYSVMSLTLGIYAINGHPLPDHNDESGNFSETKFRKKFELVKKYPLQMVADLGINYIWFDSRVKKLFTVESLGNG